MKIKMLENPVFLPLFYSKSDLSTLISASASPTLSLQCLLSLCLY